VREPLRLNSDPSKGPERLAHLTAREYVGCGHVDQATFDRYYKFAFVRNPWDRLVSEYEYRKLQPQTTFRAFVENSFRDRDDYSDASRHITPQIEFLTGERGDLLVEFVGRFETLNSDFEHVARKLGLPPANLPHRNSSSGRGAVARLRRLLTGPAPDKPRPYQDYYDPELRDRVGDYYAEDVERFGYTFDGAFDTAAIAT
jgi:hypothetical protein